MFCDEWYEADGPNHPILVSWTVEWASVPEDSLPSEYMVWWHADAHIYNPGTTVDTVISGYDDSFYTTPHTYCLYGLYFYTTYGVMFQLDLQGNVFMDYSSTYSYANAYPQDTVITYSTPVSGANAGEDFIFRTFDTVSPSDWLTLFFFGWGVRDGYTGRCP